MLNYMLLVVAIGHNYVATVTAGNAQGHSQDFTLVATEAERQSIFSQKKLTTFLAVVRKTTVLNKAGPTFQQNQFFP